MYTLESFIKKAREVHGFKYDYSKVIYKNLKEEVCIICQEHGEFWQRPCNHLHGYGCTKCGKEKLANVYKCKDEEIINRFKKVQGNRYDYSKVQYVNMHTKVCIICPEHGEFWQTPHSHLKGCGCYLCGIKKTKEKLKSNTKQFIAKANIIHKNKYNYDKSAYIDKKHHLIITCPKHGDFIQSPDVHLSGCGCPKCSNKLSKPENEIYEFIKSWIGEYQINQRDRNVISPYELDIFIPHLKIGIEYNGLYWHSNKTGKDSNYHINKLNLCIKNNIRLIQIFEDEYVNKKDIVLSKIEHILGIKKNVNKIAARKTIINPIPKDKAKAFLDKYHIQGFVGASIHLGCFHHDELIAVMSFKHELKTNNNWELTRFASNYNYICQGVGGKLFKYFIRNYNPDEVKSFADRRWTVDEDNNIYIKLGFRFDKYLPPDYRYFKENDGLIRQHKFNFRKQILHKKYGLPLTMTEGEMIKELGYARIWDCGLIKYIWKKK